MNDFQLATKKIGNRFNLVLVAAQRMREIHQRRNQEFERDPEALARARRQPVPGHQAITDIETGLVGLEYLDKIGPKKTKR